MFCGQVHIWMRLDRVENGEAMYHVRKGRARLFNGTPRFRCEGATPLNVTPKFQVLGVAKGLIHLHPHKVIREDANSVSVSFGFILDGIVFTKRKQNIVVNAKGGSVSHRFGACCCCMRRKVNWRRGGYSAWSWFLWGGGRRRP